MLVGKNMTTLADVSDKYWIVPHRGIATYRAPGVRAHRLGLAGGRTWRVLKKRPVVPQVGVAVETMAEMRPAASALLSVLCVILLVLGGVLVVWL